jgi:uncharacterized protein
VEQRRGGSCAVIRKSMGPNPTSAHDEDLPVHHADTTKRGAFYVEMGGARVAELTYGRPSPGLVVLEHTAVSDSVRGRGVGRRLVEAAVEWARATGTKVAPSCPYARSVIEKEPSLQDVLG